MSRMSVIDAAFFLFETPERPMHVGPLIVLNPPQGYAGSFADDLFNRLLERPVGEPFDLVARLPKSGFLGRWEKLKSVNVEDHVFRVSVPKGQTVEEFVCELNEDLLDMSRPLWQFYVIDKADDRRVYLFAKIHHALFDGIGMVNLFAKTFTLDPNDTRVSAPWEGRVRAPQASQQASLIVTGFDLIGKAASQASSLLTGAMTAYKLFLEQYLGTVGLLKLGRGLANPFQPAFGYFNVVPQKQRMFSHCTLSLKRMKIVAKQYGTSVNDVFMAIIDAAVSRFLVESKVEMDRPLIAEMMMATQGGKEQSNNFSPVNIPLGQPNTSLLERLLEIRRHTAVLKSTVKNLTTDTMLMYSMPLHLAPVVVEKLKIMHTPVLTDIFVSNPFGLRQHGYVMGALVETTLPLSAVAPGHVMNITGVSNVDNFHIGVVAIKSAMPELARLTDYMAAAFDDLCVLSGLDVGEQAPRVVEVPADATEVVKTVKSPRKARSGAGTTPKSGAKKGDAARPSVKKPGNGAKSASTQQIKKTRNGDASLSQPELALSKPKKPARRTAAATHPPAPIIPPVN